MAEKALEMENVSVIRDGNKILDSINITIDRGENVAIIGLNGSGKTTLVKLLRGEIYPYYDTDSSYVMRIFGESLWNVFDIHNKMGIVSMDLQNMFRDDTKVHEVIASGFFGSLDVYRNMDVTNDMIRKVYDVAVLMGIDDLLERTLEGLSLGEMRRALIARALVIEPDMLVLDEPMTGLDIVMKSKFRQMFDILMDRGVSIVMVTHDLTDIPLKIDRIVMMKDGRIYADGNKKELLVSKTISGLYGEPIKVEATNGIYRMYLSEQRVGS
jgi:iron complex transport system ATP-binding protein